MTSFCVDNDLHYAVPLANPVNPVPSFDARITEAIEAAMASAGITVPSEHFLASVRFTTEVCYGGGDTLATAATEAVATWLDIA
jgi:hypothetical protein